ncbi:MAG: DUF6438 domain-containing protein [Candidatus Woykebacteria bacterium]
MPHPKKKAAVKSLKPPDKNAFTLVALVIFAAILFIGFSMNNNQSPKIENEVSEPVSKEFSDLVITMGKIPGKEKTPVYSLVIYGDGSVFYEGVDSVGIIGVQSSKITTGKVNELANYFSEINFSSLKDIYTCQESGTAATTVTFTNNGKTKNVFDYCGPEELRSLEKKIDEVTNSKQWIEGKPQY